VRQIYDHTDVDLADAWVDEIIRDFADREMPPEVRNFLHYRLRSLLYAGRPKWALLDRLTPP
jgi:hypothetical protein